MPKKSQTAEPESTLVSAAKVIGRTAGKVASMVGVTPAEGATASEHKGKLPKKNKRRLPRRQKKMQGRVANRAS